MGSWELSSIGLGVPPSPPLVRALMNILSTAALLTLASSVRAPDRRESLSVSMWNPSLREEEGSGISLVRCRHSFWNVWDVMNAMCTCSLLYIHVINSKSKWSDELLYTDTINIFTCFIDLEWTFLKTYYKFINTMREEAAFFEQIYLHALNTHATLVPGKQIFLISERSQMTSSS